MDQQEGFEEELMTERGAKNQGSGQALEGWQYLGQIKMWP